ncbi:UNVERIFIED_CONTAM: preprotein translocase subunit SecE [Acetivibrio alkalicellulosi]
MAEEVKNAKAPAGKARFAKFFKDIRSELKKVIWPTKNQLINNTITVLILCLLVGSFIWILDLGLNELRKLIYF